MLGPRAREGSASGEDKSGSCNACLWPIQVCVAHIQLCGPHIIVWPAYNCVAHIQVCVAHIQLCGSYTNVWPLYKCVLPIYVCMSCIIGAWKSLTWTTWGDGSVGHIVNRLIWINTRKFIVVAPLHLPILLCRPHIQILFSTYAGCLVCDTFNRSKWVGKMWIYMR